MVFEVGKTIEEWKGHSEGTLFEVDDSGATLIVFFDSPTENEVDQFHEGKNFELRYSVIYDITMMTFKIGNLNWMDVPYEAHLSKNLNKFPIVSANQGLALTLMLVDGKTGIVKSLRLIGLSTDFSRKFIGHLMEAKMKEFNENDYKQRLMRVFNLSTKQIADRKEAYCKIN